jgi:phage-related protein
MRTHIPQDERRVFWVGSAKKDLVAMPEQVVRAMGMALGVAQHGGSHPATKPWKGLGAGVFEIVEDYDGNTFRTVYTVAFKRAIYVLHCFQKKSPTGAKTAKTDVALVRRRLKDARVDYEERYGEANQ